jgi:hypothetical protein
LDDVARDLLEALRNCVSVNRPKGYDLEDEQVQRTLREVRFERQSLHLILLHLITRRVEGQGVWTKTVNPAERLDRQGRSRPTWKALRFGHRCPICEVEPDFSSNDGVAFAGEGKLA